MSDNIFYQDASSDINAEVILPNKSNFNEIHSPSAISITKDVSIIKNDDSSSQKVVIIDSDDSLKFKESLILKYAPKISFDKDIKEEMYRNISFRKFISEIENGLFIFTEIRKISFDAKISYQQDWEVKDLKNIILKIKFHNLHFEYVLWLWEELSHFIRKMLRISELYVSFKEEIMDFENYNKLFYIKVDLA